MVTFTANVRGKIQELPVLTFFSYTEIHIKGMIRYLYRMIKSAVIHFLLSPEALFRL